jgi:predicted dehydrogenase
MVRIGIVGIGFMGRIHYLASQKLKGAKVAAVCSRDPAKLAGDWRNTRGNFGPEPGTVDLSGVKKYANVAELLADKDIDLIDVCTVTDQHAPLAIQALKAGKHVLVEKAIALSTADADALHFIGLVCGVPKHVFAVGTVEKDAVTYLTTSYLYGPGGPAVTCSSGAVCMGGRPFVHGYEVYLEKASLVYDSGGTPLTLLTADGKSSQPALPGGGDPLSAFTDEIQAAVDGVVAGKEPDLLSGRLARDALVLCHRECESVKTGKAVAVA